MRYYQLQTATSFSFYESSVNVEDYASRLSFLKYSGGSVFDKNLFSYPYIDKFFAKNNLKPIYGLKVLLGYKEEVFEGQLIVKSEEGYLDLVKLFNMGKEVYSLEDFENKHGLIFILKTEDNRFKDKNYLVSHNFLFLKLDKLFDFYFGIEIYSLEDKEGIEITRKFILDRHYKSLAFPKVNYLNPKEGFLAYRMLKALKDKTVIKENEEYKTPFFLLSINVLNKFYTLEELKNVETLADSVDFTLIKKRGELVKFDDDESILRSKAYEGLKRYVPNYNQRYVDRLEYELKVIASMGYCSYFLIVMDYVSFAKSNDIKVGPGRGSGASSLVSYCLNITEVDPLRFNLSFERFLNPLRKNMPDIDVDFEDDRRDEVANYVVSKYGESKVCNIVTFTSLKLRSALRAVGQIFGINEDRINSLSKLIYYSDSSFEEEKKKNFRFKKICEDPYFNHIVELASYIVNTPINTSVHPAGVILSKNVLAYELPLMSSSPSISCYEFETLEKMGYLKMDILALSNLTFIKNIENEIKKDGKELKINYRDSNTFDIINDLLLTDIFQLDTSKGMNDAIRKIKPRSIEELSDVMALYRPGPKDNIELFAYRKNNLGSYKPTSVLDNLLKNTYGIIVYQEQVISIAKEVASFSLAKADLFRQAISKKNMAKMASLKEDFINGGIANNYKREEVEKIYSFIEEFALYGFNLAHSISYSFITYQLAYLKANYPQEFYKVALDKVSLKDEKFYKIVNELHHFALDIKNPSLNHSLFDTSFFMNNFYLGLRNVKNVSRSLIDRIEEALKEKEFDSLFDFISRVKLDDSSKAGLVNLINVGYFDELNLSRASLLMNVDNILMSASFATSMSMLPVIDEKTKFTKEDFKNEFNSLGIVNSFRLEDVVEDKKYNHLVLVTSSPLYKNLKVIVDVIDCYRKQTLFLEDKGSLAKDDIISLDEYYDEKGRKVVVRDYNKEI